MPPSGWLSKLARLDAYPKINEDFFTRTASGGLVTLVAGLCMLLLFLSELRLYLQLTTGYELDVDTTRGETIQISVRAPARARRAARSRQTEACPCSSTSPSRTWPAPCSAWT